MRLDDSISILVVNSGYDDNLDPVETQEWVSLGKCIITPNTSAAKIKTKDGEEYIYSYLVLMRIPANKIIPKEDDVIHIRKKDGTIDKECRVSGFVTLRNWVKVWV